MKFYKYDYTPVDRIGVRIDLKKYDLVSETPKGYWIKPSWDYNTEHKRWVSKNGKNRKAYPTKKEALLNFQRRKEAQKLILKAVLNDVRSALRQIPMIESELESE